MTLRALEIRDTVVTSLLVLEKQRRKDSQTTDVSPEDISTIPTAAYGWASVTVGPPASAP